LSGSPAIANMGSKGREAPERLILETLVMDEQGSIHQRLWQAVIDSAIAEWVSGPLRHKDKAEYFLFQDDDDFPFVCRSAGLNPESVRESLWAMRAQAAANSNLRPA
jgi:hypothetical protein